MAITPPTTDQVRAINGTDADYATIEVFINAAVCMMNQVQPCMVGKGISDECQTEAAAWLAAHLMGNSAVGQSTNTKESESFENYSVKWARSQVSGNGIMSTPYGQAANGISGGCLQEVDKRNSGIAFFGGA